MLGMSRSVAYAAVKEGVFPVPVLKVNGHLQRVPAAPLHRLLGIEN
jgi:hypothetical protein